MRPSIDLVVVGHTVIDSIVFKGSKDILPGGSGPAVATSAAEFIKVGLVTRIGYDFPKSWMDLLRKNIDIEGIEVSDGNTTSFFVDYADNGYVNHINISLNVSDMFGKINFPDHYKNSKFVHICPLPLDDQLEIAKMCHSCSNSSKISIDFNQVYEAQYNKHKNIIKEILRYADIIFPNEIEAKMISGVADIKKSAELLYDMGPSTVVIKLGAKGSLIYDGKNFRNNPPNEVSNVVDPTGCGDAFIGGFLSSFIKTNNLDISIKNANNMAAKKIMKKGAWMVEHI